MFWIYSDEKSLFLRFKVNEEKKVIIEQAQIDPRFPEIIIDWQPYDLSLPSNTLWFANDEDYPNEDIYCVLIGSNFYRQRKELNKVTNTYNIDCYEPISKIWTLTSLREGIKLPSNCVTLPDNFSKPNFPKSLEKQKEEWRLFEKIEQPTNTDEYSEQDKLFLKLFDKGTCEVIKETDKTAYDCYNAWQRFKSSDEFKVLCNSTDRLDENRVNLSPVARNNLREYKIKFFTRLIDEKIAITKSFLGPEVNVVSEQGNQESTNENYDIVINNNQNGYFLFDEYTISAIDEISQDQNHGQAIPDESLVNFYFDETMQKLYDNVVIETVSNLILERQGRNYLTIDSLTTNYEQFFKLIDDKNITAIWSVIKARVVNNFVNILTHQDGIFEKFFPEGLDSESFLTFVDSGQFMPITEEQYNFIMGTYSDKLAALEEDNLSSTSVSQSSSSTSPPPQLNDREAIAIDRESSPTTERYKKKSELSKDDTQVSSQSSSPATTSPSENPKIIDTITCDKLKTILKDYHSTSLLSHQPFSFFLNPLRSTTMKGLNKLANSSKPNASITKKDIEAVIASDRSYRIKLFTRSEKETMKSNTGTDTIILELKNYFNS
jgi:hypothetical protein